MAEMDNYIKGNKEAWEEAFELRDKAWGTDIEEIVQKKPYAFFNEDIIKVLKKYNLRGKTIGQFCCNNGRELLSLVKSTEAAKGVGFDIAENMVAFANDKAEQLDLPCTFVAANVLDLDDTYLDYFDCVIITIGATCWFKYLKDYFAVIAKCMKKNGCIIINETHPAWNMIAMEGDDTYDEKNPFNCVYSYFEHEWIGTSGMDYITGKKYKSKTFTDYTHSLSEFIDGMCENNIMVTNMHEFDYDIEGSSKHLSGKGFPLSMILEGKKL